MLGLQTNHLQRSPSLGSLKGWSWNQQMIFMLTWSTKIYDGVSLSTQKALVNAAVGAWFDVAKSFTPAEYYTGGFTTSSEMPTSNIFDSNPALFSTTIRVTIPHLNYLGLDNTLAIEIADWAKTIWPNYPDWDLIKTSSIKPPF